MAEQLVFFEQGGVLTGDSDEREDPQAIKPYADGERAVSSVLDRPLENIRKRSEVLRVTAEELLYKTDANVKWLLSGGNAVGGGSSTPEIGNWNSGTGVFDVLNDLVVQPLNTPDTDKLGEVVYSFTDTTPTTADVTFSPRFDVVPEDTKRAYYGANLLRVIWLAVDPLALSAAAVPNYCDAVVSGDPDHIVTITIRSDGNTQMAHVQVALNAIDATLEAMGMSWVISGVINTKLDYTQIPDGSVAPYVDYRDFYLNNTFERELHYIPAVTLNNFIAANPLANGDTLGIWFNYFNMPYPDLEGRRQRCPANSNTTVGPGELFITSDNPERIPNSVPLCKRVGNVLYWIDGTVITDYQSATRIEVGEHGKTVNRILRIWGDDQTITADWRFNGHIGINTAPPTGNAVMLAYGRTSSYSGDTSVYRFYTDVTEVTNDDAGVQLTDAALVINDATQSNTIGESSAIRGTTSILGGEFSAGAGKVTSALRGLFTLTVSSTVVPAADHTFAALAGDVSITSNSGTSLPSITAALLGRVSVTTTNSPTGLIYGAYQYVNAAPTASLAASVIGAYTEAIAAAAHNTGAHVIGQDVIARQTVASATNGFNIIGQRIRAYANNVALHSSSHLYGSLVEIPSPHTFSGSDVTGSATKVYANAGAPTNVIGQHTLLSAGPLSQGVLAGGLTQVTVSGASVTSIQGSSIVTYSQTNTTTSFVRGHDVLLTLDGGTYGANTAGSYVESRIIGSTAPAYTAGTHTGLYCLVDVDEEPTGTASVIYGVRNTVDVTGVGTPARSYYAYVSAVNKVSNTTSLESYATDPDCASTLRFYKSNTTTLFGNTAVGTGHTLGTISWVGASGVQPFTYSTITGKVNSDDNGGYIEIKSFGFDSEYAKLELNSSASLADSSYFRLSTDVTALTRETSIKGDPTRLVFTVDDEVMMTFVKKYAETRTILFTPTTAPASPGQGMVYYDALNGLQVYNGSAWKTIQLL